MWPLLVHQEFLLSPMHPTGPELPISAHVACARVCRQLYVLRASHTVVQATVGVGTVIIVYIGVAYTGEGGGYEGGFVRDTGRGHGGGTEVGRRQVPKREELEGCRGMRKRV